MSSVPRVALPVAALALCACAGAPAPAPLSRSAADVLTLVGEWAGDYTSDGLGQSGSITFTLAARGDTARGAFVMTPRNSNQPLHLTITFVRVAADQVDGSLAPYADPDCGCTLYTSLAGRLAGNAISGSFVSFNGTTGTMRQMGTWKVARRPVP